MIYESHYWKDPLLSSSKRLKKTRINNRNAEVTLARVEKQLFIGFYSIRKLLETFKISDNIKEIQLELTWHKNIKAVDYFNRHEVDELFDLSTSNIESRNIEFICNQFIHSYVFLPLESTGGKLAGFYVSSDRSRQSKLYYVSLQQVTSIFNAVGSDYPTSSTIKRNPVSGQWEAVVV